MPLKIAITGTSGFIGTHLMEHFSKEGHHVTPIVRPSTPLKSNRKVIRWNIDYRQIDLENLEGHDAVIHLAGCNLAQKRWTEEYKKAIEESRVKGTNLLSSALAQLKKPPKVLLCASAVGFYGNADLADKKDEQSPKGIGFLADVCDQWEKAASPAQTAGIRVVHMRLGMVLSKKGGALEKMLPIFKLGLGGKIGAGRQIISWIALDEISSAVLFVINTETISGPVNFTAPGAVSNEEFTHLLGEALRRPVNFNVPSFFARAIFGEMADSLLLNGDWVVPKRLLDSGYRFSYPDLRATLTHLFP